MKATLDTNVIIHFYRTGCKELLFSFFSEILIHGFILDVEMKHHGADVLPEVERDLADGRLIRVDGDDLRRLGVKAIFDDKVRENRILYSPQDMGEVYAIALAQTLGIAVVVTDDIKPYGPHFTLIQMVDSEIIPLAFHEVLLLQYLSNGISAEDYIGLFGKINEICDLKWQIASKTKKSILRFVEGRGMEREIDWMYDFCASYGSDFRKKSRELLQKIKITAES